MTAMFPGQEGQFGAPFDPTGGDVGGGIGGPPNADAMFESFLGGDGDERDLTSAELRDRREEEVFAVGLHFFKKMRGMR